jgi:hypothetical protein
MSELNNMRDEDAVLIENEQGQELVIITRRAFDILQAWASLGMDAVPDDDDENDMGLEGHPRFH